jgi:pimeloyl-ACP methyl ester carboxylesterase
VAGECISHGAGGNSLSWFQQVPYFSREFTCAVLDQPGFGGSRWLEGPAEFADVLEESCAIRAGGRSRSWRTLSAGGRPCG